jgi:glutathione S-transferase
MLRLYHHGSSACAAKVRFALEEKQLAWEGEVVDIFRGEQFRPEFLALNPKAVVPVLVHDGFVVAESTVICEYIEEAFPAHPIFPASARQRAMVRQWTKAVDEELHPACSAITYVVSHRHTAEVGMDPARHSCSRRSGEDPALRRVPASHGGRSRR